MNIQYGKAAIKVLASLDKPTKARIRDGLEKIPLGDIVPLKGAGGNFRLRIGSWRILFSYVEDDIILIKKIAPRGEVYKGV